MPKYYAAAAEFYKTPQSAKKSGFFLENRTVFFCLFTNIGFIFAKGRGRIYSVTSPCRPHSS